MRITSPALLASLLVLTACNSGATLQYTLSFDTQDAARETQLASAAARVIERRLLGLEQKVGTGDVSVAGDVLTVHAANADVADMLQQQLGRPFTLRVMVESEAAGADISTPSFGSYKETGITEKHFDWVTAKAAGDGAMAVMALTPEGQAILKTTFTEHDGKKIGIFLRDVLMSQRIADAKEPTQAIDVEGIPSLEIASVFADDVNVGLHVTFTKK